MQDSVNSVEAVALDPVPTARQIRRYLMSVAVGIVLEIVVILSLFLVPSHDGGGPRDFLAEIAKPGDATWYRDVGGRKRFQIQDQDIFYSNVGHSIAAARASDIVLLGPSFVGRGIDRQTLQASAQLDGLKIYNMSFLGIRGGEFSRRIISRWNIRPRLWLINADDQFVHFFSDDLNLTIGDDRTPVAAATRSRLAGNLAVLRRNINWQIEDWRVGQSGQPFGEYRNVANGDLLNTGRGYNAQHNKPMRILRSPDCETNPAVIDYGRRMLSQIGGRVVLILVPHSQACVRQAAELAEALGIEFIPPPHDDELTTADNGGHLDRRGAARFTSYISAELVKTKAFKAAFEPHLPEPSEPISPH